jgi:hypothetical protein
MIKYKYKYKYNKKNLIRGHWTLVTISRCETSITGLARKVIHGFEFVRRSQGTEVYERNTFSNLLNDIVF